MPGLETGFALRESLETGFALRERPDVAGISGFDPVIFEVADKAAVDAWSRHVDALHIDHHVGLATIGWIVIFHDPDGLEIHLHSRERHGKDLAAPAVGEGRLPLPERLNSHLRRNPLSRRGERVLSPASCIERSTTSDHIPRRHQGNRCPINPCDGRRSLADFEAIAHPLARSRESVDEPPASRGEGPAAFYVTALWLRGIFADRRWSIDSAAAEGDLVAIRATMSGRQVRPFVSYGPDALPAQVFPPRSSRPGLPAQVFPPTGKSFASTQTHWFRFADGQVIEPWANRDDLGTAAQLGWVPPSPPYVVRRTDEAGTPQGAPGSAAGLIDNVAGPAPLP